MLTSATRGETLTPNPNECSSTLTSGTNNIYPYPYQMLMIGVTAYELPTRYGDLLLYYPHIKFLGITFDNRMTFTKRFEETLERCNQKFHHLRILVNKKWGPIKSHDHFTNLQTICKTNIRIWDCFYHTCFGICHQQNSRSPELFY